MGEAEFGLIDGVYSTTPGWLQGVEVVELEFDPKVVSYERLLAHARKRDCAIRVFTRTDAHQMLAAAAIGKRAVRTADRIRGVRDNKYYASRSALKSLPMTPAQAARVNAKVGGAARWLSPRQQALLKNIEAAPSKYPSAIHVDFRKAWETAQKRRVSSN